MLNLTLSQPMYGGCPRCRGLSGASPSLPLPGLARPADTWADFLLPGAFPAPTCSGFGEDEPQGLGRNMFRCQLTGRQWMGDPEPVSWPGSPSGTSSRPVGPGATGPSSPRPVVSPAPARPARPVCGARVIPLRQSNGSSCGQASVAMSVNCLTGKKLSDKDIARRYGFGLLTALNAESKGTGYRWVDGGDFTKKSWAVLEKRLNSEGTPVLIGLNGPLFSPSGRGHIVTLLSIEGNKVRYADPADGRIKTTTRQAIEQAPRHPDGKFMFYAVRQGQ
jgi:hypothetical protein